jgi:hypothetical protein
MSCIVPARGACFYCWYFRFEKILYCAGKALVSSAFPPCRSDQARTLLHESRRPVPCAAAASPAQNFKNLPAEAGNGERRRTKSSDSCAC